MPSPPYSPARIEISIPDASYDGQYWGRYPHGDKPTGAAANAVAGVSMGGALTTKAKFQGVVSIASAVAGVLSGGVAQIKRWHPGWYGNYNTVLFGGSTGISAIQFEMDLVGSSPAAILGYVAAASWSALETSKGVYNTALLDAIYNKLQSYAIPRRMGLALQVGAFTSTHPGTNDTSILPLYLQQDVGTYGQAGYRVSNGDGTFTTTTPSGVSGWYGGDGNGHTYAAMLHRTNVMNRFILLSQAIGAWAASKPMFEVLIHQENSFWIGASVANGSGSGYSDAQATTTQQALMTATVAALPTANFAFENTFMNTVTPCQALETPLVQKGCMPGHTDTRGKTYVDSKGGILPAWGVAAYAGQLLSGSTASVTNWRDSGVHLSAQIEAPDLGAFGGVSGGTVPIVFANAPISGATSAVIASPSSWPNGTGYMIRFSNGSSKSCTVADNHTFTWSGGVGAGLTTAAGCLQGGSNGWTPQDMADALNFSYKASHRYLVVIPDSATYVPIDRRWTAARNVVLATPLLNTSYPSNY